jgi:NACalpha-BTF3-like transcription factor
MAHEGSKPMRKAKINMLEVLLDRFVMFDDETPQDMFNHVKNLSKGITTIRKQEIAFKANKKSKNKQEVVENSSEEEEEDNSGCDDEDVALFMKKFKKYIKKKKFTKVDKKFKTTTKRTCYNCGKHGHFIANCPLEHRDDSDDKNKCKPYKKDKRYKISDKPYKKKSYGQVHIGQE